MKKSNMILKIIALLVIAILFLTGLIKEEWHYCYIALMMMIIDILDNIERNLENKGVK